MIKVTNLVFNSFQVNTYFLYDESKECMIIDPACYGDEEQTQVARFIEKNNLKLIRNINTHCHIDHILGNDFIEKKYGIKPEYHEASAPFLYSARELGNSFGYSLNNVPEPKGYITDNMIVTFGNSSLKVMYTPGHADGSVCLYSDEGFVVTGDVLFKDTIGRTDLPSGDFRLLMQSISDKLFNLPDNTIVYPGHGPETSIGYEKMNNPFIR